MPEQPLVSIIVPIYNAQDQYRLAVVDEYPPPDLPEP